MADSLTDSLRALIPDRIRSRYLAKFATVVVVALLVTTLAGVYFQGQVSAELTHEKHSEMQTTAELEADALHGWVEEYEQSARMLSEFESMRAGGDTAAEQMDHELEVMPESVVALHYVDLDSGAVEISTSDAMAGTDIDALSLKWAHNSLNFSDSSQVAVSEGYENGGQERIAFVSPVAETGKAVMVVTDAGERAEHFRDPIAGGYTQVVNSAGIIEFSANESAALTEYRGGADAAVIQAGLDAPGAVERDETDEVVAYAPVAGTDWVVLAHAPQANAYVLRQAVTRDFAVLIGLALLGFVFIGLTIGRNTVTALNGLAERAEALSEGDLSITMDETGRIDEVGQAQQAFSDTKAYLQTIGDQADAMARQDFGDAALEEDVPGAIGDSLSTMHHDIEEFIVELEQSQANAEEAQTRAEEMATALEREAQEFSAVMDRAAAGDLSQRLDEDADNRAMADIATAFNEMLSQLELTVVGIQEFADDVAASAEQVAAGSQEVQAASHEVAQSVEDISGNTEQQHENLREVAGEMTDLSATIEEIASSADEVADQSGFAATRGEAGAEVAEDSVEQLDEIRSKTTQTVRQIESLDEEMSRIGDIIDLIDDIADQTNMLALNASIEAARAGDAGEGFGVVAGEIKSLAEETAAATNEIESLIDGVQGSTDEATTEIREMRDLVAEGAETIDESITALDDIVDAVEDANTGVQSINDATDEQAASSQEVVAMVDDVSDRSNEVADESQTVSAAAEEQAASISQISDSAQALTDQSSDLQAMLEQFEASADDVDDIQDELLDQQVAAADPADGGVSAPDTGGVAADGGPGERDD